MLIIILLPASVIDYKWVYYQLLLLTIHNLNLIDSLIRLINQVSDYFQQAGHFKLPYFLNILSWIINML